MTAIVYKSTDSLAPTLSGTADSLNALLKACLVDGYGSKSAAGWSSPYYDSATKTRVFLTGGGVIAYLKCLDNGQSAGGAKETRMIGYESMSAHDTGTGLFPTVVQRSTGVITRKSATADSTARVWYLFATEKLFHLFVENGDTANTCHYFGFGAFKSKKANDDWAFFIAGRIVENSSAVSTTNDPELVRVPRGALSNIFPIYIARTLAGTSGSVIGNFSGDVAKVGTAPIIAGSAGATYPAKADGALNLSRTTLWEVSEDCERGYIPGKWWPVHSRPLSHLDTVSGSGGISTKSFLALNVVGSGQIMMETSDTWDV